MKEMDPLDKSVSIEARLSANDVSIKTKSRAASAVDYLLGEIAAIPADVLNGLRLRIQEGQRHKLELAKIRNNSLLANAEMEAELKLALERRRYEKELAETQSLYKVVGDAIQLLKYESPITDTQTENSHHHTSSDRETDSIADEWLSAFKKGVGEFTSEDVRKTFSLLLAGEIRNPGSFSIQTIMTLSRMTNESAKALQYMAPFVLDNMIIKDNKNENTEIPYLESLFEAGLASSSDLSRIHNITTTEATTIPNGKFALHIVHNTNSTVYVPFSRLTTAGLELSRLIEVNPKIALKRIANYFRATSSSLAIARIVQQDGILLQLTHEEYV